MRRILLALLVFAVVPAAAYGRGAAPKPPAPFTPPAGTIMVCPVSGARPVAGTFSYTLAAPASAGGTQTVTVAVGACSPQIFFVQGVSLVVTQNVPAGDSVTDISIGGGASTISSSNLAGGTATVVIGSGQSVLRFTTSGPVTAPPVRDCKVPNVLGLGLIAAKAAVRKAACTV